MTFAVRSRLTSARRIARRYRREIPRYRRESLSARDFLRLMRVRLSLSKIGWLACPRAIVADIRLRSLGGSVRLRSHTTDISVLRELIIAGEYAAVSGQARHPIRTIVDLGANTGLAARWLLNRYPRAEVVCVEPEPGNAAVLRHNLDQVNSPTCVVEACVGARERQVALTTTTGTWGFAMTDVENERPGHVAVVTLQKVLDETGVHEVDLLKCDIEGAEREVFSACGPWINRVLMAIVECHRGFCSDDLLHLIEANGGRFEVVDRQPNDARGYETVTLRNVARI